MPKLRAHSCIALATLLAACGPASVQAPAPRPAISAVSTVEVSALTELMRLEDTRTFDSVAFNRLAGSTSPMIRARAVLAAGRIGDRSAVSYLLSGVTDPVMNVRAHAAFALGELGDSSAQVQNVLGALTRGGGEASVEAIAALGKIGGAISRSHIEAVLTSGASAPELREALLAIWKFPRRAETTALIVPHTTAKDPEIRWRAVYALTRPLPDPTNAPRFQFWVRDADPLVRSFAVRGLRAASVDSVGQRAQSAGALIPVLRDVHPHVRINAVSVLGGYRDSTFAQPVAPLLLDSNLNVRIAAAQALGLLKGSVAANALAGRVGDSAERATIRGVALGALLAIDAGRGLAVAEQWQSSPERLLRLYAARGLGAVRSAESLALLRTFAADGDPRVAAAAVASSAAIAGDTLRAARAFFIEQLAAVDPYVRAEALGALERMAVAGDEAFAFEAFERALRDQVEDAAIAAIGVLAKLSKDNAAVQRTFSTRFPIARIPLPDVQRAAIRQLKLESTCCALTAQPETYARVVRDLMVPGIMGQPRPRVRINSGPGSFELELLAADAPLTVDNFLSLVRRGYFNGSRWHRVVPNFVLQDGDPTGTGNGGPGYAIRDEINPVRYGRGVLGMALSGPDTGGSQWFVTHSPQPHLDGGYTVFGRVVSGMEIADLIIQDDAITSIEVLP